MEDTDIIVVGGGSAGSAMTGRLAEAGLSVTLVEAGKSDRHMRSRIPALTSAINTTNSVRCSVSLPRRIGLGSGNGKGSW